MMHLNRALTTADRDKFTAKMANVIDPVTGLVLHVVLSNLTSERMIFDSARFVDGCGILVPGFCNRAPHATFSPQWSQWGKVRNRAVQCRLCRPNRFSAATGMVVLRILLMQDRST